MVAKLVAVAIICGVMFGFSWVYLLKIPVVWPDESLVADVGWNIAQGNGAVTQLVPGFIADSEKFGFGYPPLYLYLLGGWFKLWGFGVEQLRWLSFLGGVIVMFVLVGFSGTLLGVNKSIFLRYLAFLLLLPLMVVADREWWRVVHMGRPEVFILVFGLVGIVGYVKSGFGMPRSGWRWIWWGIGVSGMGLAILCHTLGIVFGLGLGVDWLLRWWRSDGRQRWGWLWGVGWGGIVLLPFGLWLVHEPGFFGWFMDQMSARSGLESSVWTWYVWMQTDDVVLKVIYVGYVLLSGWVVIGSWRKGGELGKMYSVLLLVMWVVCLRWQHEYAMFLAVFVSYVGLFHLLLGRRHEIGQNLLAIMIGLVGVMWLVNLGYLGKRMVELQGGFVYSQYGQDVLDAIPPGAVVYMTAVPDPYFALKARGENELIHFPTLWTETDVWLDVMRRVNYVIYTHALGGNAIGGSKELEYIERYKDEAFIVGNRDGAYQAWVVKLVDNR